MHCDGGVKQGGIGAWGDYSSSMRTCASIDDGGHRRPAPTVTAGPHSRLCEHTTISKHARQQVSIVKTRKVIINYVY
jgi:hypothetical protein